MTEIAARLARPIQRLGRPSTVFLVVAVVIAVAGGAVLARAYTLRDSVLPGVSVAGVDVGGLAPADARARIDAELGARLDEPVEIVVGGKSLRVTPSNIFQVDGAASQRAAYDSARESVSARLGALAVPFAVHRDVQPVLRVHESGRAALADELAALTKRAVSARVSMEGNEAVVVPGREGTAIDDDAVLASLRETALAGLPSFDVQVQSVEPPISTEAAEGAATTARTIAAAPVRLKLEGEGGIGQLGRVQLASLIRFEPKAGAVNVVLDSAGIERKLHPLVKPFTQKPENATFRVSGDRAYVMKAKNGTTLDVKGAQGAIYEAGTGAGRRLAVLGLATLAPELTTKDAKALGIREPISTFTTDMGLSSSNRIWNVHLLGNYLDGTIVKAGETFSYNEVVGPRTIARGFREGQMIFGGVLIPSIGGGVCQTATTIFNAAFEAGLPVSERHNHSWYISHYPMGRDATVSSGRPRPRLQERPEARDPHRCDLHGHDVHDQLLRDEAGPEGHLHDRKSHELHAAEDAIRDRPDGRARLEDRRCGRRTRLRYECPPQGLRAREAHPGGRLLHPLHPGEPDDGVRPRRQAALVPTSSCRPAVRAVRVRPA